MRLSVKLGPRGPSTKGCSIVLPDRISTFRPGFGFLGAKSNVNGPQTGPKLPGPKARAISNRFVDRMILDFGLQAGPKLARKAVIRSGSISNLSYESIVFAWQNLAVPMHRRIGTPILQPFRDTSKFCGVWADWADPGPPGDCTAAAGCPPSRPDPPPSSPPGWPGVSRRDCLPRAAMAPKQHRVC
jgi:hypothetical protein